MKKDFTHYESELKAERLTVINDLKGVGVVPDAKNPDDWQAIPNNDIEGDRPDSNEVADRLESYEGNSAIVQQMELRLREIDHAMKRIKEGSYGTCEVCNEPIEEDRLEANPAARTCKAHINTKLPTPEI